MHIETGSFFQLNNIYLEFEKSSSHFWHRKWELLSENSGNVTNNENIEFNVMNKETIKCKDFSQWNVHR